MKGKRVAVSKGTNLHLATVRALAAHGLKESDLKLINLDPAGAQAALTTKDVDAAFGYVELFVLRDKGVAKIVWSAAQDSYRFTRQTVLLVDDDFAKRQPQIVQRVVDTVVKTARTYSDEAQRGELFAQWGKAEFPEKVWREDFIGQPLRVRLSPLLDPFLVARYQDASEESFRLKLTRSIAARLNALADPDEVVVSQPIRGALGAGPVAHFDVMGTCAETMSSPPFPPWDTGFRFPLWAAHRQGTAGSGGSGQNAPTGKTSLPVFASPRTKAKIYADLPTTHRGTDQAEAAEEHRPGRGLGNRGGGGRGRGRRNVVAHRQT